MGSNLSFLCSLCGLGQASNLPELKASIKMIQWTSAHRVRESGLLELEEFGA